MEDDHVAPFDRAPEAVDARHGDLVIDLERVIHRGRGDPEDLNDEGPEQGGDDEGDDEDEAELAEEGERS